MPVAPEPGLDAEVARGALLDGAETVGIPDVRELTDEHFALRVVVLADPHVRPRPPAPGPGSTTGPTLSPEMLKGGNRRNT
jgi:hypothetical protein